MPLPDSINSVSATAVIETREIAKFLVRVHREFVLNNLNLSINFVLGM